MKTVTNRIKTTEAAQILGVSKEYVRLGMQKGILPIGTAIKMSSIWTYYISPKLLEEFSGVDVDKALTAMRGE